jgi:hypothetical protein
MILQGLAGLILGCELGVNGQSRPLPKTSIIAIGCAEWRNIPRESEFYSPVWT